MWRRLSLYRAKISPHAYAFAGENRIFLDAVVTKTRRIIDEWGTGVKGKISLSFKGIIDIARSAESVREQAARRPPGAAIMWFGSVRSEVTGAIGGKDNDASGGSYPPG